MIMDRGHKEFMAFVSKVTGLASEYSIDSLNNYLRHARKDFPSLIPVIKAYIQMIEGARGLYKRKSQKQELELSDKQIDSNYNNITKAEGLHLFDLLRSKELFPLNKDLADFASRVLPAMKKKRYDKMSRSDIAGKIIDYLDTLGKAKRRRLENSMRQAIESLSLGKEEKPQSFFSKWENIIKGIDL